MPKTRVKTFLSANYLQIIIGIIAYAYILYKLYFFFLAEEFTLKPIFLGLLPVALLLMPLNWFLEALKWRVIISPVVQISINKSIRGILMGLSLGIFTPNRWGELPGRLWVIPSEKSVQALLLSGLGSVFQAAVTLLFGIPGFLIFRQNFGFNSTMQSGNLNFYLVAFLIVFILVLLFYGLYTANFGQLKHFNFKKKYLWAKLQFQALYTNVKKLTILQLSIVFAYSSARYLIFFLQFWILLFACNLELTFFEAAIGVSSYFFVLHFVPVLPGTEPGIRTAGAIAIFEAFSPNVGSITLVAMLLWLINLALPASIGSLLLFKKL